MAARLPDGWDICVVINERRVVLGLLGRSALRSPTQTSVENAMTPGPSTIRPSARLEAIRERMRDQNLTRIVVTRSDGTLFGVVRSEDLGAWHGDPVVNGSSVPLSIALTAGGLAVVNPCAFPLLPAFLSFYLGADERRLPAASTRALQGLLVGALVAAGFPTVFAAVGLPLSLGLSAIADAVPWLGFATGAALACTGVFALAGASVHLPSSVRLRPRAGHGHTAGAMFLFGVGYGAASLGCTLPIFLALVGASLGAAKLTIFAAYAAGMTLVLMALAVTVAFTRQGMTRFLRRLLPHIGRLAGLLLLASGGYLLYYWYRVRFGDQLTLADDPVVGFASRYSGQLETFARQHGTPFIAAAAAAVALALALGLRHHWRTPARTRGTVPE